MTQTFVMFLLLVLSIAAVQGQEFVRPPDGRSTQEVSQALTEAGISHTFYSGPLKFLTSIAFAKIPPFLPLSNMSRTTTIGCHEGDLRDYPLWNMDRYGFNNDDTVYSFKQRVLIVGDAFANGHCVHQDQSVAGVMRRNGYPAATVGSGGFGPILELATLTEYGQRYRPKVILWLHQAANVSHLQDSELRSAFVLQYLKDGFTQNLVDRQAEVDLLWKHDSSAASFDPADWERKLDDNLPAVRTLLSDNITTLRNDENLYRIFGHIIGIAKRRAALWGGQIYVVMIPRRVEYQGDAQLHRLQILDQVRKIGVPVIDLDRAIRAAGEPLQFFASRYGFFNSKGYQLMAHQIMTRLAEDSLSSQQNSPK